MWESGQTSSETIHLDGSIGADPGVNDLKIHGTNVSASALPEAETGI